MPQLDAREIESFNIHEIPVNTVPPEIERIIIWSFGHSIIEFESVLYEKFHIIAKDFVVGKNEFLWHLENMEERGVLVSSKFKGVRSWSRLR